MATATKAKPKAVKKAAQRKPGADRQSTPPLTSCPYTTDFTRPHSTESSGRIAQKAVEVQAAKEIWKQEVRAAFKDGAKASDLPEFPVSKYANPNTGQMSLAAYDKLNIEYEDAIENETKPPVMPPRYNPVLIDLTNAMNCMSLRRGSIAKHPKPPKNWDEEMLKKAQ